MRVFLAVLDILFGISVMLINIKDVSEMEGASFIVFLLVCFAFLGSGLWLLLC